MIRPYHPGDADVVLTIWRESSAVAHPFLDAAFLDKAGAMIRDVFLSMAETWIVEVDGTPVGFVAVIGTEIGGLFVLPDHHGSGLGRALMDKAMQTRTAVELDVFKANPIGRNFYARYGFVEGKERIDDMSGHPVLRLKYARP